jgi:hypothetical protein
LRTSAGALQSVALTGQAAAGLAGTTFGDFGQVVASNSGAVVFSCFVKQGSNEKEAIILWLNRKNQIVAVQGQTAPGSGGSQFESFVSKDLWINDAGDVAFIAQLDDGREGVFVHSNNRVSLVALSEQVAPGAGGHAFGTFGSVMINNQKRIVFDSDFFDEGGGVFLCANDQITVVAISGGVAPGTNGRSFTYFRRAAINDLGNVVFFAYWGDAGRGIFSFSNNALAPVALSGQLVPGASGSRFFDFYGLSLNDRGDVAFTAALDSSSLPSTIFLAIPESN